MFVPHAIYCREYFLSVSGRRRLSLEQNQQIKNKAMPLTKEEKTSLRMLVVMGLSGAVIAVVILVGMYLLRSNIGG